MQYSALLRGTAYPVLLTPSITKSHQQHMNNVGASEICVSGSGSSGKKKPTNLHLKCIKYVTNINFRDVFGDFTGVK
jgi:hypothetical protein